MTSKSHDAEFCAESVAVQFTIDNPALKEEPVSGLQTTFTDNWELSEAIGKDQLTATAVLLKPYVLMFAGHSTTGAWLSKIKKKKKNIFNKLRGDYCMHFAHRS